MNHDFLPVHLIQTFVAFVEAANVTEAAEKLGISQPAVSVHLRKFEEMLPHPVFIMRGKRKVLSPYGQTLYESLAPAFHQIQKNIQRTNLRFDPAQNLEVKICGPPHWLERLPFSRGFAGTLRLYPDAEAAAMRGVLSGAFDMAIGAGLSPPPPGLIRRQILEERVHLCAHRSLIAQNMDFQNPKWLSETPFISYGDHPPYIDDWLRHCGADPTALLKKFVVENWQTIRELVEQGRGFSILPFALTDSPDRVASLRLPETFAGPHAVFAHFLPASAPLADLILSPPFF